LQSPECPQGPQTSAGGNADAPSSCDELFQELHLTCDTAEARGAVAPPGTVGGDDATCCQADQVPSAVPEYAEKDEDFCVCCPPSDGDGNPCGNSCYPPSKDSTPAKNLTIFKKLLKFKTML